jgi:anti-sigma factor RsiW
VSHDRFEEMLARRSELTPAEEARLEEHLQGCPQCRATAAVYERQAQLLRSLPPVNPPPSLRAGVLAGIREIQPPRRRWWSPRPLTLVGPAAAVLLIVAALAFHNLHTAESPGNTAAQSEPTVPARRGPMYGAAAGSADKGAHKTSSQPKHASRPHPSTRNARAQRPVRVATPTSPPIQNLPGAAPAPTAAAPDSAFGPVVTRAPKAHAPRLAASQAPVKAASHPVPTSRPAPKPPVPAAPPAPVPTPVPFTPVPVTGITSTAPAASSPGSTATPTPTSTSPPKSE